jgi:hypothetical protein
MKSAAFANEMTWASPQPIIAVQLLDRRSARMRTFKRLVILLAVACVAAACAALPPAPSYVPSPFAGMHGQ